MYTTLQTADRIKRDLDAADRRLDEALRTWNADRAKLARADGSPIYAPAEDASRRAALAEPVTVAADNATKIAAGAAEELQSQVEPDPLLALSPADQERALALLPIAREDASRMPLGKFTDKLATMRDQQHTTRIAYVRAASAARTAILDEMKRTGQRQPPPDFQRFTQLIDELKKLDQPAMITAADEREIRKRISDTQIRGVRARQTVTGAADAGRLAATNSVRANF